MADGPRLHRLHHLVRPGEDGPVGKAGGQGSPAVDAGQLPPVGGAPQLQGLLDDGGEVPVRPDVDHAGVAHRPGGEHPVRVALLGRHQAVGGEQDGGGDTIKLLLLVLPGRAEVAL